MCMALKDRQGAQGRVDGIWTLKGTRKEHPCSQPGYTVHKSKPITKARRNVLFYGGGGQLRVHLQYSAMAESTIR